MLTYLIELTLVHRAPATVIFQTSSSFHFKALPLMPPLLFMEKHSLVKFKVWKRFPLNLRKERHFRAVLVLLVFWSAVPLPWRVHSSCWQQICLFVQLVQLIIWDSFGSKHHTCFCIYLYTALIRKHSSGQEPLNLPENYWGNQRAFIYMGILIDNFCGEK